MSNVLLVTGEKPAALAVSVYPVAVLLRLRSPNVATPPTAVTGVVPLSVAPPGLPASAMLTDPANPDARIPSASNARIVPAAEIWCPATAVLGSVPHTGSLAVPGWILSGAPGAVGSTVAGAARQQPVAVLSRLRCQILATRPWAASGVRPPSALRPGLLPS